MNEKIRVCGKDLSSLYYILYYILIHLCINDISYCWQPYFPSTHMYHRIGRDVINRFITGQGGKPETGQSQYREGSQKLVNHCTGRKSETGLSQYRKGSQKLVNHSTGREARNWSITVQEGSQKLVYHSIGGKPETGLSQYRKGSQKPDYHRTGREVRNQFITGQGLKSETGPKTDYHRSNIQYKNTIKLDKFQKKTIIHPNTANKENLIWAIFQYLLCKNDKHILSSCSTIFKDLLNQPSQLCRFYLHNISRIFEQRALNNIYYYEE